MFRCDKFSLEIANNYKALGLWMVKADNMIQWLSECEKLLEAETQIGDDHQTLEEQLHDNEVRNIEVNTLFYRY